ncbi:hypothetical protein [Sphingorhabdus lacus]|uniref:ATPase n=1 Tax=Sphingorhabdus lacus TaxID=392610 RepID=A0A6I6L688_9SPHN|nr:hypothetical protein [Sphingorhabdus lacus]QGY79898.1 hypothetical protein EUU25_04260 [Sphingorhabdus lacus]
MTARSKIVGLTRQIENGSVDEMEIHISEHDLVSGAEPSPMPDASPDYDQPEDVAEEYSEKSVRWTSYLLPFAIVTLTIGWTAYFVWTYLPLIKDGLKGEYLITLISIWATPAMFLAILWLLVMRSSRAEAFRFRDVALSLRKESEALEMRMRTVNEEISMARSFLAQNARELETVGKQSSQSLMEAAQILTAALLDSDEKAKTLETVSNAATTNLEQLRKHLPVVTSAAKDVTNQIGSAGNNAQLQIKSLIAGLARIGEVGTSTRAYIDDVGNRADAVSEQLGNISRETADSLNEASLLAEKRASAAAKLLDVAAQNMSSQVGNVTSELSQLLSDNRAKIEENVGLLKKAMGEIALQSQEEKNRIASIIGDIENHLSASAATISEIDKAATDQTAKLAFAVSALGVSAKEVNSELDGSHSRTEQLLERADGLLSSLNRINAEIAENIPASIGQVGLQISGTTDQLASATGSARDLNAQSSELLKVASSLSALIDEQSAKIGIIMQDSDEHFAARHEQADALSATLNETRTLIESITQVTEGALVSSLLRVREVTEGAVQDSRKIVENELTHVADRLADQNRIALEGAVENQLKAMNEQVQNAIERNISLSESSTAQLTTQLKELDELADNLEKRIAESRNSFDGIDDDSFARRMVLLTESLNSTSIDVAKILSNEVTDTAWAAYLKGDRGVFTRRAVRLLDAGESRAIATHYGQDAEFREHVNRYIHDFEAMMRILLSTRDGNAICVTLLSSDVGKLYVALAQAIERLRN